MSSSWRKVIAIVLGLIGLTGEVVGQSSGRAAPPPVYTCAGCDTPLCAMPYCVGCEPDACCGPRWYGQVEGLLWWLKGDQVPPLVTTDGPAGDGSLASPTASVLGGGGIDTPVHGGFRLTFGSWLDDGQSMALEASYFQVIQGSRSFAFAATADGGQSIFQPFFDVLLGTQGAIPIGIANGVPGGIAIDFSQRLMGAELNGRFRAAGSSGLLFDLLAGFRYLALEENLDISTNTNDGININTQSFESFATRNRFYGAQVGANLWYTGDRWWVSGLVKLGIGGSQQQAEISGFAVDNILGVAGPQTLLAQTTNSGTHERGQFVFVPEFGLTAGLSLRQNLDLTVGYTFLWISDVLRPGSAIDFSTTVPLVPDGPPQSPIHPAFTFHGEQFWAQGINLGLQWRY